MLTQNGIRAEKLFSTGERYQAKEQNKSYKRPQRHCRSNDSRTTNIVFQCDCRSAFHTIQDDQLTKKEMSLTNKVTLQQIPVDCNVGGNESVDKTSTPGTNKKTKQNNCNTEYL